MKYRRTKIIPLKVHTDLPNAPKNSYEMIKRQIIAEEAREYLKEEKPPTIHYSPSSQLKEGNILKKFYQDYVLLFLNP